MCGKDQIYDGEHSGKLINGDGLFTRKLKEFGIDVKNSDLDFF